MIDTHSISFIIGTLRTELGLIPPRVNAYIAGLALFPPPFSASRSEQPSFEHIENCLKLLDSWLLLSGKRYVLQNDWNQGLANELVALSVISELLSNAAEDKSGRAIGMFRFYQSWVQQ